MTTIKIDKKQLFKPILTLPKFTKINIVKRDILSLFKKERFCPFRKWWWKEIKYIFYDAKNRFWYGYSDRDWFNWDYEFAERNIELFKQFRDNSNSLMHKYPHSACRNDKEWVESMTKDEQKEFFNMLIECLEDMRDCGETAALKLFNKDLYDCTKEEREKVFKERQNSIDLFFETVRDRFDDFWD